MVTELQQSNILATMPTQMIKKDDDCEESIHNARKSPPDINVTTLVAYANQKQATSFGIRNGGKL